MSWFQRLGLAGVFALAVAMTLLAFRRGSAGMESHREVVAAPIALSVPVEIIRDGEAPSMREVEVRP